MNFLNDFERREFIARQALLEIKRLYPLYFKYYIHFTTGEYDPYDAYYFVIDDKTQQIVKRVWIELKMRDNVYPEYILETKKMNSLIKLRKELYFTEEEVSILYINFCPNQTEIYNIDKVKDLETTNIFANKCTVESRKDKVEKKVIMLKPEYGKVIPYIINEKQILRNIQIEKVLEDNKKTTRIGLNFMFDM